MSKPIIEIDSISKCYQLGAHREKYFSLRDEIAGWLSPQKRKDRAKKGKFWALDDVSFSVERGEAVGIIGRNGAGKSTLLKILSQITPPTRGKITMRGRVASLLEVGTGFHPELTGRENIYLNGAILGMTRKEIARKFDEIVAFAEVEKFLDTPVKRYSSGMYVRLAFAVAAHLEPEILVIDEVLAVGDVAFQKKCLGKMGDVAKSGRTVLFVSHNMAAVQSLCTGGIVLDSGQVAFNGNSTDAVEAYIDTIGSSDKTTPILERDDRLGDGIIRISDIVVGTPQKTDCGCWVCGKPGIADLHFESNSLEDVSNIEVAIIIESLSGQRILYLGSRVLRSDFGNVSGSGRFRCKIPKVTLAPGQYVFSLEIRYTLGLADRINQAVVITVEDGDFYGTGVMWPGMYLENYDWELVDDSKH